MKKRVLSLLMVLLLCVQMLPLGVFAAADPGTNLCEHHQTHEGCGYAEGSPAVACTHGGHTDDCHEVKCSHVCDESCNQYSPCTFVCTGAEDCLTSTPTGEHDASCYASQCTHVCGEDCADPCAFVCTGEGDCVTQVLNCQNTEVCYTTACSHVHDDTCREALPCGFTCTNEENCLAKTLICGHAEDGTCCAKEEVAAQPCGYECPDCAAAENPCTCTVRCEAAAEESCQRCVADMTACVGMLPVTPVAGDTDGTYTLTLVYECELYNGAIAGTGIEDVVIKNIPYGTVIDLSDYWPDEMTSIGSDGKTYYFGNYLTKSVGGANYFDWKVTSDMTLYAGWLIDQNFTVTFDGNGGNVIYKRAIMSYTRNLVRWADNNHIPEREGYKFLGWSYSKDSLVGDTDERITQDVTLYAVWEQEQQAYTHSHCVCGGNTNIGDHTSHTSDQEWQATDTLPTTAGYYYLTSDITLTESWKPVDGIYLCLNGKVIRQTVANQNAIAFEEEYASLTLTDCGTEIHKFSVGDDGVWALDADGDKELIGGVITGTDGLSAVFASSRSKLNFYNVNIVGNKCTNGGGILTRYICNLYDVTVVGNSASYAGGGIRANSATLSIYGGEISHNTSFNTGGGIDHSYGELLIDGTLISKNTSMETGGGIWNEGTLTIKGGNITENSSKNSTGGGVWNHSTRTPVISGDTIITGNTGKGEVNNLHLASDGTTDAKITVGELGSNASVGVSVDSNHGMIISDGGKDHKDKFFSDNGDYAVAVDGENLKLVEAAGVQVGQVTLKNGEYTTDGKKATTTKPESGGYAYFENGVLTLNNFTYSGSGENDAVIYYTSDLTINAIGTNSIDSTEKNAVYLKGGDLTIEGDVLNLAVSNAEEALITVLLYDSDGTYGKLNITDVTLNIDNDGNDQTDGVLCGDILIDGSTLNVTMKKERQYRGTGLDASGTVAIVRNSQVVIDLSEATGGTALIADGDVSVSDSYVELRGDVNDGVGLAFNTSYRTLEFNGGTLIIAGTRDPGGAMYLYSATIELPDGGYWWRTDENGSYSKGDYTYNTSQTYIELTTTEPHTCNYTYEANDNIITESCTCGHSETATIVVPTGELVYDGNEHKAKIEYSNGWKGNKDYQLAYLKNGNTPADFEDAGEYSVKLTIGNAAADASYTVKKAILTVTAKNHQITYGDAPIGNGVDIDGFVPGEDENVLKGELGYDFGYMQYEDAGQYSITPKGFESDNYEFTYVPGTLKVVAAEQSAPASPAGVNTSYIDTTDGKITGVDSTMEYRKEGDANYTAVTGTEIANLMAGKYYVRYAAKANYNASPDKEITISLGGKRTAAITGISDVGKTYDGSAVADPTCIYAGDGQITIKWYDDNNGAKGREISKPVNAGTYWVGVSASAGATYNAASEVTKQFTVAKAVPTIPAKPTVSRVIEGNTLSTSTLTGGEAKGVDGAALAGSFRWKDGSEVMDAPGKFKRTVVFTPDSSNYRSIEFEAEVEVEAVVLYCVITFDPNGGKVDTKSVRVVQGGTLSSLPKPTRSNYSFRGWYTARSGGKKVTTSTVFDADTTLYARWKYTPADSTNPPTGDSSHMILWTGMLLISAMGIAAAAGSSKRRRIR